MSAISMRLVRCVVPATLMFEMALAAAAPIVHVTPAENTVNAFIFDWQPDGRAVVVSYEGRREASVLMQGAQRVVTLDTPFSQDILTIDPDCPAGPVTQRYETQQFGVTRTAGTERRGSSSIAYGATLTTLDGCNAGRVETISSITDPGFETRHLAMSLRPSIDELVPGSVLAGPSEASATVTEFPAADVMTLEGGNVRFARTGNVHPLSTADGWLVLGLPAGERAYTRYSVDRRTGGELWIAADWAGGMPERVIKARMVQPDPAASFGGVRQASRMWESGLSIGSNNPFQVHLYQDGTGERVFKDLAQGTESRSPITWALDGSTIRQTRAVGPNTGVRTWMPLRNSGRLRYVLEEEVLLLGDGSTQAFIPARVNSYVDTGPAQPPAP